MLLGLIRKSKNHSKIFQKSLWDLSRRPEGSWILSRGLQTSIWDQCARTVGGFSIASARYFALIVLLHYSMPLIRFTQYNVRPDESTNLGSQQKRECSRLLPQDNVRPDEATNHSSYLKENDPYWSHSITCHQTRRLISAHTKSRIAPDCSHSITCPQTRRLISAHTKNRIAPDCSHSITCPQTRRLISARIKKNCSSLLRQYNVRPDESTNPSSQQKETDPDCSNSITCAQMRRLISAHTWKRMIQTAHTV